MFHGSLTNIKDNNGKTALDIAKELEPSAIKQDIIRLLTHKPGLIEILQYRTPLVKVDKSWNLPSAYMLFNIYTYMVFFFLTGPLWANIIEIWFLVATFIIATIFWIVTMNKDPGYIKPNPNVEFLVSFFFSQETLLVVQIDFHYLI